MVLLLMFVTAVFPGFYFPAFGLNKEICRVNSVRMRENTDQKKLHIWTLFTQCVNRIWFFFAKIETDASLATEWLEWNYMKVNPFVASTSILFPLNISNSQKFSFVFSGCKMWTLARNCLMRTCVIRVLLIKILKLLRKFFILKI